MSTPEPPSGPPAEAGGAPEPGHRARALAASLLGELTGQRKSGLTFAPLEPSGLSVSPLEARGEQSGAPSPADPEAPSAAEAPSAPAEAV
ncbi:MAG: hypothetical protein JWO60_808, partial [Frankiales bacterium]|nr:hypothetical protein [Frankiales bacterium]